PRLALGSACRRAVRLDAARDRDPAARLGGLLQRAGRADALGHRADGEVPPLEHLSEARRREPDRGEPLGTAARLAASDAAGRRAGVAPKDTASARSRAFPGDEDVAGDVVFETRKRAGRYPNDTSSRMKYVGSAK